MSKSPKVVLLDIESLPNIVASFSLYPDSINHENILKHESIVCICWKELNKKPVYATSVLDDPERFKKDVYDDYAVLHKIREVLEDADIVVGHNVKKFDRKKVNARLIYHKLPPLPSGIHYVDTLTELKKVASFPSHRLDYLSKQLGGDGKFETSRGLWIRSLQGDEEAIKEMVKYCKSDVRVLEEVYLAILPYLSSHPHMGALEGDDKNHTCPRCGSPLFLNSKIRYSAAGVKKIQRQCAACFGYSTFNYTSEE